MAYQNRLYVWDDRFLYLTEGIVSGLTQRHTVTLLVSLGEAGFRLGDGQGRVTDYPAALIGNQTARSLDASRAPLLSMNFDPQSYEYHCLAAMLGRQAVRPVIVTPGRIDAATLRGARDGSLDPAGLFRLTTALPQALSGLSRRSESGPVMAAVIVDFDREENNQSKTVTSMFSLKPGGPVNISI